MRHDGEVFTEERIELGEDQFSNCRFESCRLIYDGSAGVRIENCDFEDSRLELTAEAGNTLSFLQNLFHGFGEDGRLVVESFFDQIRQGKIGQPEMADLAER